MGSATSTREPLKDCLDYEPQVLKFGTSGRRGKVVDLTQLEIYTNVVGELEYLLSLKPADGGIAAGDDFYFAYDLRPSSTQFVENQRGGIAQAVVQAVLDKGLHPVNLGPIPTPALTYYALQHGKGSLMVTGSHIPFDRNGYKLNTSKGELMKTDEAPINASVQRVRDRLMCQSMSDSVFNEHGNLRLGKVDLPPVSDEARNEYIQRYRDFFPGQPLSGLRLLVYEHSAVGREVLTEILREQGASVVTAGRSSTFVPIDTEAVDINQLQTIQKLIDETGQRFDAVVSTDGDSDRPLLVSPESNGELRFFGGDLLGMIVAEYLGADAVVVPISTNDAIDRGALAPALQTKTKIGSPYVIAGMAEAVAKGHTRVCGWEANGGFLTASNIRRNDNTLAALPTRDAVLPLLCVLAAAKERSLSVPELFATLPARSSRAGLLREFPRSTSMEILAKFSIGSGDPAPQSVEVNGEQNLVRDSSGASTTASTSQMQRISAICSELEQHVFTTSAGFSRIARLDYTDGLRIIFANGDVAHVRPSGNADELRIYAVADTQGRANEIVEMSVREPDGLLRTLARVSTSREI